MFKNFASAVALLAIGAYADNHEKPFAGGELHTMGNYKYGRFVASIKGSKMMGTGTAFYLYDLEEFSSDQDVFDFWHPIVKVPHL